MAITYKYSRVNPMLNAEEKVIQWVIGVTAEDSVSGKSAYIDGVFDVEQPFKVLTDWTLEQKRAFADAKKLEKGWEASLAAQIAAQIAAPTMGPSEEI